MIHLTKVRTDGRYKSELNPSNPLSHNGEVAKAYAGLVEKLLADDATSSFAPRQFKSVIGRYGPAFSGYGQQDSQEFLLFLLDGLQEDLNRIMKKPYIEKPDSTDEMVTNREALQQFADKNWEIYKARNDSVITDLFAGMYKSTLVCPKCDKVSIIFDPFNNLTLQIPIENVFSHHLFYFPFNGRPVRMEYDIDKNSTISQLKDMVGLKMKADPERLVMAEVYKYKFYKMFENPTSIAEAQIGDNDDICIYEIEDVPTNYNPNKRKKQSFFSLSSRDEDPVPSYDSPGGDKMIISVFHRRSKSSGRGNQRQVDGTPSYAIITREDAKDYDAILQKVLGRVAQQTTRPILTEDSEYRDFNGASDKQNSAGDQEDTESVSMVDDDQDGLKVKDNSDDGFVDVSMRDASNPSQMTSSAVGLKHEQPEVLRPGAFIPPALRNLFEMKVMKAGTETVPLGWSSISDTTEYPTIASRMPQQTRRRSTPTVRSRHYSESAGSDASEESSEPMGSPMQVNRPISPASTEASDEDLPSLEELQAKPRNYGKNRGRPRNRLITYSRKGKQSKVATPESEDGDRPLIVPGEAIILDWSADSWDAVFGGSNENDMKGMMTAYVTPVHEDPELEARRKARKEKKRKGATLDDCLDEFGKPEILSENDAWYCPRCKEHRRASKTFELWRAPDILVIHLKRFSSNRSFRDKLDVLVDFPTEGLDLAPRLAEHNEGKSAVYDLFAVDNHYGGLGGGHYTAFARNFYDGNWYDFNGE